MSGEHRRLIEATLGRALGKDEVVHHIDRNRKNNTLENLVVLTRYDHARVHWGVRHSKRHLTGTLEIELANRLTLALAGESPETFVQRMGISYGKAKSIRMALRHEYIAKTALGILLMLDSEAGPVVLEYLRGLVAKDGAHDPRD